MKDLIDREAAIEIVRHRCKRLTTACVLAVTDIEQLPPAQTRMTCDGCKYANHPTGWSDVCVLCIRNFRNFTDRYDGESDE